MREATLFDKTDMLIAAAMSGGVDIQDGHIFSAS